MSKETKAARIIEMYIEGRKPSYIAKTVGVPSSYVYAVGSKNKSLIHKAKSKRAEVGVKETAPAKEKSSAKEIVMLRSSLNTAQQVLEELKGENAVLRQDIHKLTIALHRQAGVVDYLEGLIHRYENEE
jgi:hypothetical protein